MIEQTLEENIHKQLMVLKQLTKERDFYKSKLREIKILCLAAAEGEGQLLKKKILDILYKDGFVSLDVADKDD